MEYIVCYDCGGEVDFFDNVEDAAEAAAAHRRDFGCGASVLEAHEVMAFLPTPNPNPQP